LRKSAKPPPNAKPKKKRAASRKTIRAAVMRRKNVRQRLRRVLVRGPRVAPDRGLRVAVRHAQVAQVLVLQVLVRPPGVGLRRHRGRRPAVRVLAFKRGVVAMKTIAAVPAGVRVLVAQAPGRSRRHSRARLPTMGVALSSVW
jgi:hypothetical protein